MVLGDHLRRGSTPLDQLDDMETVRATYRIAGLARLQRGGDVDERRWQFVDVAPAEVAAFERVLRVRKADGRCGKIESILQLPADIGGLGLRDFDLRRRCAIGQRNEDMANMHVAALDAAVLEHELDFGIADLDATLHDALAQALHDRLVMHVLAELLP